MSKKGIIAIVIFWLIIIVIASIVMYNPEWFMYIITGIVTAVAILIWSAIIYEIIMSYKGK